MRFVLPINPESYEIAYPPRSSVTHTKAGAFVERTGLGLPRIRMQGTFGLYGTLKNADGSPRGRSRYLQKGVEMCGWEI